MGNYHSCLGSTWNGFGICPTHSPGLLHSSTWLLGNSSSWGAGRKAAAATLAGCRTCQRQVSAKVQQQHREGSMAQITNLDQPASLYRYHHVLCTARKARTRGVCAVLKLFALRQKLLSMSWEMQRRCRPPDVRLQMPPGRPRLFTHSRTAFTFLHIIKNNKLQSL